MLTFERHLSHNELRRVYVTQNYVTSCNGSTGLPKLLVTMEAMDPAAVYYLVRLRRSRLRAFVPDKVPAKWQLPT